MKVIVISWLSRPMRLGNYSELFANTFFPKFTFTLQASDYLYYIR